MKRIKILAVSVLGCISAAYAQNESDALKYTETFLGGTARSQGTAGAFGAVGADFSATVINPAGLGLYRRNEANFGIGLEYNNSKATYLGNTSSDFRANVNIPNWGFVGTKVYSDLGEDRKTGLVSWSIATGMTRVASYQSNIQFNGINTQSSILDYYKQSLNGYNANDILNNFSRAQNAYANFPGAVAYNYFLIDTATNATSFRALTDGAYGGRLMQQQQMRSSGAANEYNLSSGVNLSNVVYLGAGLILKHAYSETDVLFSESSKGTIPNYNSSSLRTEINSNGFGLSGRFGIIVRPIDWFKVGFTAQTPSRMRMRDNYKYTVSSNNSATGNPSPNTDIVFDPRRFDYIDYDVISPSKLTFSSSLTLPTIGFLSVDYETVDYTQMRMEASGIFFTDVNNNISSNMKRANNLRVGAEVKIAEYYRLRAGYARYESPYKTNGGEDLNRYAITGGIGFLVDRIFIDAAIVNSYGKQFNTPYTSNDPLRPSFSAVTSYSNYNFVLSGGIRF